MEVVGEAFLSAAIGLLFEKLASSDLWRFAKKMWVHTDLKTWEKELSNIRRELNDVEEKQIADKSVKEWLSDLRDLAYDMEDVLGEFAYDALGQQLKAAESDQASTSQVRKLISICSLTEIRRRANVRSKAKEITCRLEEISARKSELGLEKMAAAATTSAWQSSTTTSMAYEPWVFGRDGDKRMITEMILREEEPTETNVSVISIVGMGGVGKTTLALMVYNDEETAKKFSLKAWVCVSNQYDMVRITKTILEAVTSHSSNLQDFNQIQRALSETLRGKRFLIVLDDLWNEDYGDWNCLRSPFWAGGKGSKIIVTTRCKGVATMMGGEKNLYELKHLSYEDCWLVFEKHAFENRSINLHPSLVLIGKKIVEKCAGLPLAAKALGGLLRTKLEEEEWENILNSKVWNLQGEKCGNIIPTLRLSYNHLPSHLKRCFAYCAIFPKNYEFMEKELILLWMAEGLIQCSQDINKQEMEDLGHDYFHEMMSMSFFQPSNRNISQFVMHDFIHDLAQFVAEEICFHLEDRLGIDLQCSISKKIRYSSFICCYFDVFNKFEFFHKVGHLRTFIALPVCSSPFLPHY